MIIRSCLGFFALTVAATSQEPAPLVATPVDFATGLKLEIYDPTPVQTVLLHEKIYRGVVHPDLRDLRVFNQAGEEVPHVVRHVSPPETEPAANIALPFFALRGEAARRGAIEVNVETQEGGSVVQVRQPQSEAPQVDPPVVGYLIDASRLEVELRGLQLQWKSQAEGFMTRVDLEHSDDLDFWQWARNEAPVVDLAKGGERLLRPDLDFSPRHFRYFRLTWNGEQPPFELTGVVGRPVADRPTSPRQELSVGGQAGEAHTYTFDLGGPFPVDHLAFDLPQPNTVARGRVESASEPEGPWRRRGGGKIYRLNTEVGEITSAPLLVPVSRDRYWRLVVAADGGGLGAGMPSLTAGWRPEQVAFVARGEGPFTLAYGSHRAIGSRVRVSDIQAAMPSTPLEELEEETVVPGATITLGGEAALRPARPPTPWKVYTLWAVLIGAVLLLGVMALRLIRQLNTDPAP